MANTRIKRGPGKRMVDGKSFRLADEVRYIQRRAADHTGRVISIGQLILFSSKSGDAWLLDPSDQLAARLARDGDPEPIHIDETDTTFAIGWKGHYRIDGPAFIYVDRDNRTNKHHPRISDASIDAHRLTLKFQIFLASLTESECRGLCRQESYI
jgi:hypothetical protein